MGDSVTYSEMSFTNKHNSHISSGLELKEELVTYAAVRNKAGEKKKKTKSDKPNVTQQASSQPDNSALTYATVNKPKKAAEKSNSKSGKAEEVSPQDEDVSRMYGAIHKSNKSAPRDDAATATPQPERPPETEDVRNLQIPTRQIRQERHWIMQGRRRGMCLVSAVIGLFLILLITVIYLGASCNRDHNSCSASNISSERSLRCPDPWIPINDKCYFFSVDKKSHVHSDIDCTDRGSRLALVKEGTIRRLVTITGKEFWVGLSQYHTHGGVWTGKWTDGSTETVTNGTGSCAKLGSHLTLENCYAELHWICERDTE